jgi:L-threonylcarbamoyladenylate synthase
MSTGPELTPFFEEDIRRAVTVLQEGGVILYPTDTIWGLGCLVSKVSAIQRIYEIKKRYEKKSLILLVNDESMLLKYVSEIPPVAFDLIQGYHKPLTVVYPGAKNLPSVLIASDKTIAIRIVKHVFCEEVIRRCGEPMVSTSANISGQPAPASFSAINELIREAVDYVAMTDRDKLHKPAASTIIRLLPHGDFETIRD